MARSHVSGNVLPSGVAAPYPITKTRLFSGARILASSPQLYPLAYSILLLR